MSDYDHDYEHDLDEWQQIMALDDGEPSESFEDLDPSMSADDAVLMLRDRARGYREARNLMRKLRVARDYFLVVVERERATRRVTGRRNYPLS